MKLVKETRKIWVSIETISLTLFLIFYMLSPDLFKFPLVDGSTSLFGLIQNESSTFFFFFFFFFFLIFKLLLYLFLQNDINVKVTATCIRVPVMRAHAESVNLQFENPLDEVIM
jgi:hypothetical protein